MAAAVLLVGVAGAWAPSEEAGERHGWLLVQESASGTIETLAPAAAFALEAGQALTPFDGEETRASFRTELVVRAEGQYRFGLETDGVEARLVVRSLAGDELGGVRSEEGRPALSDWIALERGRVALAVPFVRTGGRARLRTSWERRIGVDGDPNGFPLEPLASVFTRVSDGAAIERAERGVAGRALLERKGCTRCHAPSDAARAAVGERAAPDLTHAGDRLSVAWAERWVRAPSALKTGADMPALVADDDEARALARFLGRSTAGAGDDGAASPRAATEALVLERGRALYHRVGCVACHGALASQAELHEDAYLDDALPDVGVVAPFGDVGGKWSAASLSAFLRDPLAVYPDGRMPSLALDAEEADAIASYLAREWGEAPAPEVVDDALAERGRVLWTERACSACHAHDGVGDAAAAATPLELLDPERGCLDPVDARTPRYDLAPGERELLADALRSLADACGRPSPLDVVQRTLARASCLACHARDGDGGPADELRPFFETRDDEVDLGDEGRIPPDLSGVGAKLTSAWLGELLVGDARARPYVAARMPHYADADVQPLVEALARVEGVRPHADRVPPEASDESARIGRELMGRSALACVTCHVYRDYPPAGTPGLALTDFGERLRYEWFTAFLHDPQRYRRGSRMPSFGRGDTSTLATVLDGDLARQIDAMWAYFELGDGMPAPEGVRPEASNRLVVEGRPIVLRTFLEGAGCRGIAVGLPVGVHFGFDAGGVRLTDAWRGEFLDASGAWAGRGGQVSGGRGASVWSAPDGPPIVLGPPPAEWPTDVGRDAGYRFRGYRLDAGGVPTFLYSIGALDVSEHITAQASPAVVLTRRLAIEGLAAGDALALRPAEAATVRVEPAGAATVAAGGDGVVRIEVARAAEALVLVWEVAP